MPKKKKIPKNSFWFKVTHSNIPTESNSFTIAASHQDQATTIISKMFGIKIYANDPNIKIENLGPAGVLPDNTKNGITKISKKIYKPTHKANEYLNFSKSSIELYLTCKLAFAFKYIIKPDIKEYITIFMALGDALHYMFKKYLIENFTPDSIKKHWCHYWNYEYKRSILLDDLSKKSKMTGLGIEILDAFCLFIKCYKEVYSYRQEFLKRYIKPCFHTEINFQSSFDKYSLDGRFDLLLIKPTKQELEIILLDYKTGYGEPSWQEKLISTQFDIYQWGIISQFGIEPRFMGICYYDRTDKLFKTSIVQIRTNNEYHNLKLLLDEMSANIEGALYDNNLEPFTPIKEKKDKDIGKHCRVCIYRDICEGFIKSRLSLSEYANEYIESKIAKHKSVLQDVQYEQLLLFPLKHQGKNVNAQNK